MHKWLIAFCTVKWNRRACWVSHGHVYHESNCLNNSLDSWARGTFYWRKSCLWLFFFQTKVQFLKRILRIRKTFQPQNLGNALPQDVTSATYFLFSAIAWTLVSLQMLRHPTFIIHFDRHLRHFNRSFLTHLINRFSVFCCRIHQEGDGGATGEQEISDSVTNQLRSSFVHHQNARRQCIVAVQFSC